MRGRAAGALAALALLCPAGAAAGEPAKRDERCGPRAAPTGTLLALHSGAFWIPYTEPFLERFCRRLAGGGFRVIAVAMPPNTAITIRRVYALARRERARGRRVYAYGESSGGTYAALLAVRGEVHGAVAVAAPSDLLAWNAGNVAYWRDLMKMDRADRRAASPLFHVRPRRAAPLLLLHSPRDEAVSFGQSLALHRAAPGTRLRRLRGAHLKDCRARPRAVGWLRALARRTDRAAARAPRGRLPRPSCPLP